jgi:predicted RNA-binding Zn-ribbon protein involved in translation (DUF1610 family)
MPFACPACGVPVEASLEHRSLRCPTCGARLRSRVAAAAGDSRAYEVEVAGQPETRRRVELPWDAADERRLEGWLRGATLATLGLVLALLLAALWLARG